MKTKRPALCKAAGLKERNPMTGQSVAPRSDRRQPAPPVTTMIHQTTLLLARAIHAARGGDDRSFFALPNAVQQLRELEAARIIREGDHLAQELALHEAADAAGVSVERVAEAFAAYDCYLLAVRS